MPQRDLAWLEMDQKHLQNKKPVFTWLKEGQGWGWSSTRAGERRDLVLS